MNEPNPAAKPNYNALHSDIDGFDSLAELALDLHWSWNHSTDEVWRQLDPVLWQFTQNPWVVLQTVSQDKLKSVLANPAFRKTIDALRQTVRKELASRTPATQPAQAAAPAAVQIIDGRLSPASAVAAPATEISCFATDSVDKFERLGSRFLGRPVGQVQLVDLGG